MAASKNRLRFAELPSDVRKLIADMVGGPAATAENCTGGFSPGVAARLRLRDGSRVFVKAIDCAQWPSQAALYRSEAVVAAALPTAIPAPRFLGCHDDGRWVVLAFECIDGAEPARPWRLRDLRRVVTAARELAASTDGCGLDLPREHPRLGGWAALATDNYRRRRLAGCAPWAASRITLLTALETAGCAAAQGTSLVHFDMYAHNILLTADRVWFVDWPFASLGAPYVDVVVLLASAAADGIDPEPFLAASTLTGSVGKEPVDGVLAAHAGFCLAGAMWPAEAGLEPIYAAKLELGLAALAWLRRRLEG